MRVCCKTFLCACLAAAVGLAQHHEMKPPVEKPVALYEGMGNWRHPIATRNAEAQKFFDQGLALLYGFNRYEALRSFRKAAELDPGNYLMHYYYATALSASKATAVRAFFAAPLGGTSGTGGV